MINTILHPHTKLKTETFLKKPSHALLLSGASGVGKLHLAKAMAQELGLPVHVVSAAEQKSSIGIEQIRDLYSLTRSGSPLCIIIQDAELLSTEAQNAFLKLLEEPPKNVLFALTVNESQKLLSTIRSRVQEINVLTPKKSDLSGFIQKHYHLANSELASLMHTTRGMPGTLMKQLADDALKKDHLKIVEEAKNFYQSGIYERHMVCIEHSYEKAWTLQLLDTLALILEALLRTTNSSSATILLRQVALLEETAQRVSTINGNPKIHMARLAEKL